MITKGKIFFQACIIGSHEFGSNDEHLITRIYYALEVNGTRYNNLHTDVKLTVGDDFETGFLEVYPTKGLPVSVNYFEFRDVVDTYYRSLFGKNGLAVKSENSKNSQLINLAFQIPGEAMVTITIGEIS